MREVQNQREVTVSVTETGNTTCTVPDKAGACWTTLEKSKGCDG